MKKENIIFRDQRDYDEKDEVCHVPLLLREKVKLFHNHPQEHLTVNRNCFSENFYQ